MKHLVGMIKSAERYLLRDTPKVKTSRQSQASKGVHGLMARTPSMLRAKPMMSRSSAALTARTTCKQQPPAQGDDTGPPLPSTAATCLQEEISPMQSTTCLADCLLHIWRCEADTIVQKVHFAWLQE